MKKSFLYIIAFFLFVPVVLITGLLAEDTSIFAQGHATSHPIVETAVTLTINPSLNPPIHSMDEQIETTAPALKTVWIEDAFGEMHEFMRNIPPDLRAKNRERADYLVVIGVIQKKASPLSVTGCGGDVDRYQEDYEVHLVDRATDEVVDTTLLRGFVPNPFILRNCNPLRGSPAFEDFFHWLAPLTYVIATPTFTPSFTPTTPRPTATPPSITGDTFDAVVGSNEGDLTEGGSTGAGDIWKYEGIAGETLSIRTQSSERRALIILIVYDASGNELAHPHPATPIENLILPADGEYLIVVRPFTAIQGPYTLIIESDKE